MGKRCLEEGFGASATTKREYPDKEIIQMARDYPVIIEDTVGVEPAYQCLHHHNMLEINLIKAGTGCYVINGERYDFQAGDIFLINNYDLHCAFEQQGLVLFLFEFDAAWLSGIYHIDPELTAPFTRMGIEFVNQLDRANPHLERLRELLLRIQAAHDGQEPYYRTLVFTLLLEFLVVVNRHFRVSRSAIPKAGISEAKIEKMKFVLKKLEETPEHHWTIKEMAGLVFFSPSYFSNLFRQAVGVAPMQHLINLRLGKACEMLQTTDEKIVSVALRCGFHSLSNFNRLFKRYIKMEPHEYKDKS